MATSAPRWAVWLVVAGATVVVLVLSSAVWLTVVLLRADAAHDPLVALEELARDHPVLTLEVAGDVDRDEVAALAAALGEDPELLTRWLELLVDAAGSLTVGENGIVGLTIDIDGDRAVSVAVDPDDLPRPGDPPAEVVVNLDLDARGLAAGIQGVTGRETTAGDVVQRLLGTPAGVLLGDGVDDRRARLAVEVEVAGAGGLALLTGVEPPVASAGEGRLALPADVVAAATDLLLGVPARGMLAAGSDAALDLGPTDHGRRDAVAVSGVAVTGPGRVQDVPGSDLRIPVGPEIEFDLVALLAAGLEDRGAAAAAAVVDGWAETTLTFTVRRVSEGPRDVRVADGLEVLDVGDVFVPISPTVTGAPDDAALRELERDIGFLAMGAEEVRSATGSYPETITEVVNASVLAVDPIRPVSTLGWTYRVGATTDDDLCLQATHETGVVWSARASGGWTLTTGAC